MEPFEIQSKSYTFKIIVKKNVSLLLMDQWPFNVEPSNGSDWSKNENMMAAPRISFNVLVIYICLFKKNGTGKQYISCVSHF